MEGIKEYFLSAIGACLIIGYAENLVGENFKPYVKFIAGLFIVLLLASPAISLAADFASQFTDIKTDIEFNEYETGYDGIVSEFEKNLSASVRDYIEQNTGIDKENIEVHIETDKSDIQNIKVIKIYIILSAEYDCNTINRMVSTMYNAETETVYKGE